MLLRAHAGDQIRIHGHHVGEPDRCGEIIETRGANGASPFVVRWDDSDHVVLFFPGPDTTIDHLEGVEPLP